MRTATPSRELAFVAATLLALVGIGATGRQPTTPSAAATFVGAQKCKACHGKLVADWQLSRHAVHLGKMAEDERACEHCHGAASEHVEAGDGTRIYGLPPLSRAAAKRTSELCAGCHPTVMDKPHWDSNAHQLADVSCADCHQFHGDGLHLLRKPKGVQAVGGGFRYDPDHPTVTQAVVRLCLDCHKPVAAQLRQRSHHPMFEDRVSCTDCHDVHQGGDTSLLRDDKDLADTCVSCHADKRGPFVFEHEPVRSTGVGEGCLSCHLPHGSPNPKLTRTFRRSLCTQCHSDVLADPSHQSRPGNCWRAGCHARIHGSNSSHVFLDQ
jgi:predicted CXXCH cytochrome family protein